MASQKRLSAIITIGGSVTSSLRAAFGAVRSQAGQVEASIASLTKRQRELNRVISDQEKLGRAGSALKVQYAHQELATINKQIAAMQRLRSIEGARQANLTKRAELRGQMFDAVALGAAAGAPIAAAVRFENAMLGVAKQLDGARDESGKLTAKYYDMAAAIQKLGHELPSSTDKIAEMVAAGLRMGVASDQVLDFVRASSAMATAFELPEGELAESMGKIAGLYKIPIPAIGQLADAINYLDDNAISKGGDIIDYLQRVGGVAGAVKIGSLEVAALGSTLLTLGERTETAGTATNAMLQKLAAADKGTKKFKSALRELGLSTKAIQKGMQTDAMGTMLKVLDAVSKLKPEKQIGVLTELVGLEHSDTMAKLATNTGELRKQLELANSEAAKGSMGREFQARMQTTSAQWQIMKNRANEFAVNLGAVVLPTLNSTMGSLGPVVSGAASLAREFPMVTKAIVGTATALAAVKIGALAAGYAFTFVQGGALALAATALRLGTALRIVGTAAMFVGRALLLNPIGLAVTAIAGAAYLIYQNWEPLRAWFSGLWTDITAGFTTAVEWITAKIDWVGEKWRATKAFFGFGNDAATQASAPTSGTSAPPPLPEPAMRGASGAITDNSQTAITITQLPGESQDALARRVADELERRKGVRQRAAMTDGAYAQ